GTHSSSQSFISNDKVAYTHVYVDENFNPDLSDFDLLITGNPTDHIALFKIKDKIYDFLQSGKALFCFSGWYLDYIPGNKWVMERDIKSIDIRYFKGEDRHNLLDGVNIDELIYQNGISGWWACGHIEKGINADAVLLDTLKRPIMILDEHSTAGTIICTASGPLSDSMKTEEGKSKAVTVLYHNLINFIIKKYQYEEDRISI
ncbi:hypothetical protein N9R54_05645, partial [Pelobium sp.]